MHMSKESAQSERGMKPEILMMTKVKIGLVTSMTIEIRIGLMTEMIEEGKTREKA